MSDARTLASGVVIQVLRPNVRHDCNRWLQPEERSVAFVTFHHHIVSLADLGTGSVSIDHAPFDDRPIQPPGVQKRRNERSRRSFPLCATDADRESKTHQLSQHVRAMQNGSSLGVSLDQFWIVVFDGGGVDHGRAALHLLSFVADEHPCPERFQTLDAVFGGGVGSRYCVAASQYDFCYAAHASAADSDEVDWTGLERRGTEAGCRHLQVIVH